MEGGQKGVDELERRPSESGLPERRQPDVSLVSVRCQWCQVWMVGRERCVDFRLFEDNRSTLSQHLYLPEFVLSRIHNIHHFTMINVSHCPKVELSRRLLWTADI